MNFHLIETITGLSINDKSQSIETTVINCLEVMLDSDSDSAIKDTLLHILIVNTITNQQKFQILINNINRIRILDRITFDKSISVVLQWRIRSYYKLQLVYLMDLQLFETLSKEIIKAMKNALIEETSSRSLQMIAEIACKFIATTDTFVREQIVKLQHLVIDRQNSLKNEIVSATIDSLATRPLLMPISCQSLTTTFDVGDIQSLQLSITKIFNRDRIGEPITEAKSLSLSQTIAALMQYIQMELQACNVLDNCEDGESCMSILSNLNSAATVVGSFLYHGVRDALYTEELVLIVLQQLSAESKLLKTIIAAQLVTELFRNDTTTVNLGAVVELVSYLVDRIATLTVSDSSISEKSFSNCGGSSETDSVIASSNVQNSTGVGTQRSDRSALHFLADKVVSNLVEVICVRRESSTVKVRVAVDNLPVFARYFDLFRVNPQVYSCLAEELLPESLLSIRRVAHLAKFWKLSFKTVVPLLLLETTVQKAIESDLIHAIDDSVDYHSQKLTHTAIATRHMQNIHAEIVFVSVFSALDNVLVKIPDIEKLLIDEQFALMLLVRRIYSLITAVVPTDSNELMLKRFLTCFPIEARLSNKLITISVIASYGCSKSSNGDFISNVNKDGLHRSIALIMSTSSVYGLQIIPLILIYIQDLAIEDFFKLFSRTESAMWAIPFLKRLTNSLKVSSRMYNFNITPLKLKINAKLKSDIENSISLQDVQKELSVVESQIIQNYEKGRPAIDLVLDLLDSIANSHENTVVDSLDSSVTVDRQRYPIGRTGVVITTVIAVYQAINCVSLLKGSPHNFEMTKLISTFNLTDFLLQLSGGDSLSKLDTLKILLLNDKEGLTGDKVSFNELKIPRNTKVSFQLLLETALTNIFECNEVPDLKSFTDFVVHSLKSVTYQSNVYKSELGTNYCDCLTFVAKYSKLLVLPQLYHLLNVYWIFLLQCMSNKDRMEDSGSCDSMSKDLSMYILIIIDLIEMVADSVMHLVNFYLMFHNSCSVLLGVLCCCDAKELNGWTLAVLLDRILSCILRFLTAFLDQNTITWKVEMSIDSWGVLTLIQPLVFAIDIVCSYFNQYLNNEDLMKLLLQLQTKADNLLAKTEMFSPTTSRDSTKVITGNIRLSNDSPLLEQYQFKIWFSKLSHHSKDSYTVSSARKHIGICLISNQKIAGSFHTLLKYRVELQGTPKGAKFKFLPTARRWFCDKSMKVILQNRNSTSFLSSINERYRNSNNFLNSKSDQSDNKWTNRSHLCIKSLLVVDLRSILAISGLKTTTLFLTIHRVREISSELRYNLVLELTEYFLDSLMIYWEIRTDQNVQLLKMLLLFDLIKNVAEMDKYSPNPVNLRNPVKNSKQKRNSSSNLLVLLCDYLHRCFGMRKYGGINLIVYNEIVDTIFVVMKYFEPLYLLSSGDVLEAKDDSYEMQMSGKTIITEELSSTSIIKNILSMVYIVRQSSTVFRTIEIANLILDIICAVLHKYYSTKSETYEKDSNADGENFPVEIDVETADMTDAKWLLFAMDFILEILHYDAIVSVIRTNGITKNYCDRSIDCLLRTIGTTHRLRLEDCNFLEEERLSTDGGGIANGDASTDYANRKRSYEAFATVAERIDIDKPSSYSFDKLGKLQQNSRLVPVESTLYDREKSLSSLTSTHVALNDNITPPVYKRATSNTNSKLMQPAVLPWAATGNDINNYSANNKLPDDLFGSDDRKSVEKVNNLPKNNTEEKTHTWKSSGKFSKLTF